MRAIIAEDEPQLRKHLRRLLTELWPELEIYADVGNGTEALELVRDTEPDVAFLDIRLPGLSGMEVARQIANRCRVVFITAYDRYAVEAFEQHAVDYLLKPVTRERLRKTIERIKRQRDAQPENMAHIIEKMAGYIKQAKPWLQWIRACRRDSSVQLIHVDDIAYFKSEDKYTIIRMSEGSAIIRASLKQLDEELNPEQFWRIHRNAIVNLRWIDRVQRHFGGKVIIHMKKLPDALTVSRSYAHRFGSM